MHASEADVARFDAFAAHVTGCACCAGASTALDYCADGVHLFKAAIGDPDTESRLIRPECPTAFDVVLWLRSQPGWEGTFARSDLATIVEHELAPWAERLIALRWDIETGRVKP
jgi:hypothetical protein